MAKRLERRPVPRAKTALDSRVTKAERKELLTNSGEAADSLADILDNLLELSRHQANRLQLHKRAADVGDLMRQTVAQFHGQSSGHSIVLDVPAALPKVAVDEDRFRRVLHNLIENAVKYTPEDTEARVFARHEDSQVTVGVSDHGSGISAEDQARLFQPFQRLRPGPGVSGVGLGLVVCKRLVEAHGGRIWVDSKPGEGSTFQFTIPLGNRRAG